MRKLWYFIVIVLLASLAGAQDTPPRLTQIDFLYVINPDETVTLTYQIGLAGETTAPVDMSLALPIPGTILDVTPLESQLFPLLDQTTIQTPYTMPMVCDLSPTLVRGHGPGFMEYASTPAEIADYQVADETVLQVDYHLTARVLDASEDYYSTVLHLPPPVQITYQPTDANLSLPLAPFHALSESPYQIGINVYVLADAPYSALSATLPDVDTSGLRRGTQQIKETLRDTAEGSQEATLREMYDRLVSGALDEAETLAFIRQYSDIPGLDDLPDDNAFEAERETLAGLLEETPFVTRLHAESPLADVIDPVFVPDPDAERVSADKSAAIDPVYFHGCTTENLRDPVLEAALPDDRVYVDLLNAYVPIMEGWKLFEFPNQQQPEYSYYAVAPTTTAEDTVSRAARGGYIGDLTGPVLGLDRFRVPYLVNFSAEPDISPEPLAWADSSSPPPFRPVGANGFLWYWPHPETARVDGLYDDETPAYAHGIKIRMIAPVEDYIANAEAYDNLLRHFATYQYFTHPDLRHTLFLGGLDGYIQVGYPEGWHTMQHPDLGRLVLPSDADDAATQPYVRVTSVRQDDFAAAIELYGLSEQQVSAAYTTPVPFEMEGRQGFIRLGHDGLNYRDLIVAFSVPAGDEADLELMQMMAAVMRSERADS